MSNIRVHKLAGQLNITSKELIAEIKKQGIDVKNHMSTIDEKTADTVKKLLSKSVEAKAKTPESKKKASSVESKPAKTENTAVKEKKIEPVQKKNEKPIKKEESVTTIQKEPVIQAKSQPEIETKSKQTCDVIKIPESITVKELSEKLKIKGSDVIKTLMVMGTLATINQTINKEAAQKVASKFNIEVEIISIESDEIFLDEEIVDKEEDLEQRSPVVTIMGHVDHGKTSLLDAVRETNVTEKEAGGITQHIGAYKVQLKKGAITFLDTPGHAAFTAMRARGAQVTDIVVLIVAADDGVMPQTIEAINHAKDAGVPIIVAINKIDKPGADPENVKQMLTEYNLVPEEWGGDIIFVNVSAKEKIGLDNLLEMILLQSEMLELKANPKASGRGIVIEANLDKGRGAIATVLVQKGTFKIGDPFVVGSHYGKIRALINDKGTKITEAGPAVPVEVLGFSDVPDTGDSFIIVKDEKQARQIGTLRLKKQREKALSSSVRVTLDDLYSQINEGKIKELKIILKADVQGSLQALSDSLQKLGTADVCVNVIHSATGGITDSDIMLAAASNAVIIGFNVRPNEKTVELSKRENVDLRLYTIIYNAISDVKSAMEGLLDPIIKETVLGEAEVREVFTIPKIGVIAGCYITNGKIIRNSDTRLIRDGVIVYTGKIASLRRFKDDAKEVAKGFECGISIEKFHDIKRGDIIQPYESIEVIQTL